MTDVGSEPSDDMGDAPVDDSAPDNLDWVSQAMREDFALEPPAAAHLYPRYGDVY